MVVVFAPQMMLNKIIQEQAILKKLFGNGWVQMAIIEPDQNRPQFCRQAKEAGNHHW
jgi:uncharacterized protein